MLQGQLECHGNVHFDFGKEENPSVEGTVKRELALSEVNLRMNE